MHYYHVAWVKPLTSAGLSDASNSPFAVRRRGRITALAAAAVLGLRILPVFQHSHGTLVLMVFLPYGLIDSVRNQIWLARFDSVLLFMDFALF